MKNYLGAGSLCGLLALLAPEKLMADDAASAGVAAAARYGWFNALDHRSRYGQGAFPEPFLVDDSDLETGEFRLDWLRTASGSDHSDNARVEIEQNSGLTTFELEVPYERDAAGGSVADGLANVSLGARRPFYQCVARGGGFDTTLGAGVELGLPTTSDVSHNTELVPKMFCDTKTGDFTVEAVFGDSMLFGPGEESGLNTWEYAFVFGYSVPRKPLPLPGVERLIPITELKGQTQLNHGGAGQNSLVADAGLRMNLKAVGRVQPRPGIVFVFPVDNGGRAQAHWGIMTSLVFEF